MDPFVAIIVALVLIVSSFLISSLTATKPKGQAPNQVEDFDFPQSEEGTPQTVVFGDVWVSDWTVLWYGDYAIREIKSGGGGKK